jgi:hypothetical protein
MARLPVVRKKADLKLRAISSVMNCTFPICLLLCSYMSCTGPMYSCFLRVAKASLLLRDRWNSSRESAREPGPVKQISKML